MTGLPGVHVCARACVCVCACTGASEGKQGFLENPGIFPGPSENRRNHQKERNNAA